MGIQGLLKALENVQRDCHVKEFAGKTAAIDAHGWLHAALAGSALDVELDIDAQAHVRYCARRISMLRKWGVEPVFVFDGAPLPAKMTLLQERRQRREVMRREGELRLSEGDLEQAKSCLAQAVEITEDQIDDVVRLLATQEVKYIHAPFEADAQMVYLAWHGHVDFCISEDSDLLALGCPQVLYKLRADGFGREILLQDALNGFSLEDFQAVCVLMGCDYLPRLHGVGPALALRVVMSRGCEPEALVKELQALGISVPSDYAEYFRLATMVFQLQPVYEPRSGQKIPLQCGPCGHQDAAAPRDQLEGQAVQKASGRSRSPRRRQGSRGGRSKPAADGDGQGHELALQLSSTDSGAMRSSRVQGASTSAFLSDCFEPARPTLHAEVTLEEFVNRAKQGEKSMVMRHLDGGKEAENPVLSADAGKSRFFQLQRSRKASLWSD